MPVIDPDYFDIDFKPFATINEFAPNIEVEWFAKEKLFSMIPVYPLKKEILPNISSFSPPENSNLQKIKKKESIFQGVKSAKTTKVAKPLNTNNDVIGMKKKIEDNKVVNDYKNTQKLIEIQNESEEFPKSPQKNDESKKPKKRGLAE